MREEVFVESQATALEPIDAQAAAPAAAGKRLASAKTC